VHKRPNFHEEGEVCRDQGEGANALSGKERDFVEGKDLVAEHGRGRLRRRLERGSGEEGSRCGFSMRREKGMRGGAREGLDQKSGGGRRGGNGAGSISSGREKEHLRGSLF